MVPLSPYRYVVRPSMARKMQSAWRSLPRYFSASQETTPLHAIPLRTSDGEMAASDQIFNRIRPPLPSLSHLLQLPKEAHQQLWEFARTGSSHHINDSIITDEVAEEFDNLDKFFMWHGILLSDLQPEFLFHYIRETLPTLPYSVTHLQGTHLDKSALLKPNELFPLATLTQWKQTLYGKNCIYPIPLPSSPSPLSPLLSSPTSPLSSLTSPLLPPLLSSPETQTTLKRRQFIIESKSWSNALDAAYQESSQPDVLQSNLHLNKNHSLLWNRWITDMSPIIASLQDQDTHGYEGPEVARKSSHLPPQRIVPPEMLALLTCRIAIHFCSPSAVRQRSSVFDGESNGPLSVHSITQLADMEAQEGLEDTDRLSTTMKVFKETNVLRESVGYTAFTSLAVEVGKAVEQQVILNRKQLEVQELKRALMTLKRRERYRERGEMEEIGEGGGEMYERDLTSIQKKQAYTGVKKKIQGAQILSQEDNRVALIGIEEEIAEYKKALAQAMEKKGWCLHTRPQEVEDLSCGEVHVSSHFSTTIDPWPLTRHAAVGARLLHVLTENAFVDIPFEEAKKSLSRTLSIDDINHLPSVDSVIRRGGEERGGEERGGEETSLDVLLNNSESVVSPLKSLPMYRSRFSFQCVEIPAFRHRVMRMGIRTTGVLELSPLVQLVTPEVALPLCISPPTPWTSLFKGQYLTLSSQFVRMTVGAPTREYKDNLMSSHGIFRIMNIVSTLSQVPWKINPFTLSLIESIWESNSALAGVPPQSISPLSSPPVESDFIKNWREERMKCINLSRDTGSYLVPHGPYSAEQNEAIDSYIAEWRRRSTRLKELEKLKSIIPTFLLKLNVARNYRHCERFYFPHSLDFRGRCYPIPPHLNHQGDDISRGLLMFAEGKSLGERGWRWLKIHCANLFGMDKKPLEERVAWTESHLEALERVVSDPLGEEGLRMWSGLDEPFQALAAAKEVVEAWRSGRAEDYVCSLPVHQDGSCNGLQHYAALGLDEKGAKAVNIVPCEDVQDVYRYVLEEVILRVRMDAEKKEEETEMERRGRRGEKGEEGRVARLCLRHGVLERKVVKQTVMTICYGVTYIGAVEQIRGQIKDILLSKAPIHIDDERGEARDDEGEGRRGEGDSEARGGDVEAREGDSEAREGETDEREEGGEEIDKRIDGDEEVTEEMIKKMSLYLARQVLNSVDEVFSEAKKIQIWLDQLVDECNKRNLPVTWITPLGFVCSQPYYEASNFVRVLSPLQTLALQPSDKTEKRKPHKAKQKLGFPPNFVHSLDATHMLMTAEKCLEEGIPFASVHDSFWALPSDVDCLNENIRKEFVSLYSRPILEDLRQQMVLRFGKDLDRSLPPVPERGNLDIQRVVESTYFFH